MAVFTFKHAFIGKAKQAAGTASAHVRYITRKSATHAIASEGMPRHRHAVQRFMDEREASIRKNGRVCDKFIIAVPKEMDQAQALHTLRRFGNKISHRWDGEQKRVLKASYFLTLQDWDTHNPHCHFVFVDADRETGERVFGTTRKGSTERLRATWENVCNDELERLGIEAKVDRRPQHVIEAEQAARTELDRRAENQSAAQKEVPVPESSDLAGQLPPSDAPTHELPESPASAHEQELVQEDEMAGKVAQIREREDAEPDGPGRIVAGPEPVSVVAKVRGAYQLSQRLRETKSQRKLLTTALSWKETAQERSDEAARSAAILMQQEQGFERRHTHGHVNGTAQLRGYQAPSWSFLPSAVRGWQSKARKDAVAAQSRLDDRREEHAVHVRNRDEAQRTSEQWEQHTRPQAQNVPGHPNYAWLSAAEQKAALAEMEQAEKAIEATRTGKLDGLTPEAVWTAYKAEEITLDEARDAAQATGFEQLAEALENEAAQEQEEGLGA
ncbi:hypothetical protein [Methylorubrum sp. SB2]|uniref:hypothetical protein n=1 Tax=Methylorubrum subtropicum TaxID=3138812 RepID=UPI00313C2D9C